MNYIDYMAKNIIILWYPILSPSVKYLLNILQLKNYDGKEMTE